MTEARTKMKTLSFATALALALVAVVGSTARAESPDDILVVANNAVGVDKISQAEARGLFLKHRKSWSGGGKAIPIHAKSGTSLRADFVRSVLEMAPTEERYYWEEQKIRKGLEPPVEFSNTLKAVFRLRGSVSYVYRSDYVEGTAKVLLVIPG